MRTLLATSFLVALLAAGCGRGNQREYTLQGQILSVAPDHLSAQIKHEEIAGFMAAMTMTYKVRDPKEYASLKPGDLITSTLIVADTDAYLKAVRRVGEAPLERTAADTAPGAASGFELVKQGAPVPDFAFVNQDGEHVSLATYRGSALVVTFTYTSCPMPTFCPMMDRNFAALQAKLKAQNNRLRAHLLSVTIDPTVDTPAVLKAHGAKLGLDPRLWSFLTGERDSIDKWASGFGVSISRATNDPKDITHNLRTVIIDRQGNLVQTYTGNEWTPEQVFADVQVMVGVD